MAQAYFSYLLAAQHACLPGGMAVTGYKEEVVEGAAADRESWVEDATNGSGARLSSTV